MQFCIGVVLIVRQALSKVYINGAYTLYKNFAKTILYVFTSKKWYFISRNDIIYII